MAVCWLPFSSSSIFCFSDDSWSTYIERAEPLVHAVEILWPGDDVPRSSIHDGTEQSHVPKVFDSKCLYAVTLTAIYGRLPYVVEMFSNNLVSCRQVSFTNNFLLHVTKL